MIEITSQTLKFINKNRNGDHCLYEILEDNLLIAVVADGVSRQPCDWKASRLACEQLLDQIKAFQHLPLDNRLTESIIHANEAILTEKSACRKMATTLSTICVDLSQKKGYFGNIGDSRIYRVRENELLQLTTDDTIKRTKTIITDIGRRNVDASILTKSLGMDTSLLGIQVHPLKVEEEDMLILATDGYYSARLTFEQYMIALSNSKRLQQDFEKTFTKFSQLAGDDMTAIAIRI